jgi:hypothetical protein
MSRLRRRLRHFTWIALVAMLGLGVLPAISHALARAGGGDDWAEVCTALGLARVAGDGSPVDPGAPPALHAMAHCPYCSPGMPAAGLPAVPWRMGLAPVAGLAAAPVVRLPPARPVSWREAQPRAPPAGR